MDSRLRRGLFVSALLDLPAGAVIVWVLAVFGVAGSLLTARFLPAPAAAEEGAQ